MSRLPRSPARLVMLGVLALAGTALLLSLSVWQLHRREWKRELIGRVEARVHAAPVAAPGPAAWERINARDDEYLHVAVSGRLLNDRETLVKAVTAEGAGFWVLTPLLTPDGHTYLLNRGFVPAERRDPSYRAAGQLLGEVAVKGLLRLTEPRGAFLHANVPEEGRWYSRDVVAIAQARGLSAVAPYFIDLDAGPVPEGLPEGGLTVIAFPNSHLVYALTWLTLALMLAGNAVRILSEEWPRKAGTRGMRRDADNRSRSGSVESRDSPPHPL